MVHRLRMKGGEGRGAPYVGALHLYKRRVVQFSVRQGKNIRAQWYKKRPIPSVAAAVWGVYGRV